MSKTIEEMIAIVQIYIKQRKDKDVSIAIRNPIDILKLQRAYNIANEWLTENNAKITKLN